MEETGRSVRRYGAGHDPAKTACSPLSCARQADGRIIDLRLSASRGGGSFGSVTAGTADRVGGPHACMRLVFGDRCPGTELATRTIVLVVGSSLVFLAAIAAFLRALISLLSARSSFLRRALLALARASRPRAKRCRRTAMSALLAATLRLRRWPRLSRAELCAAAAPSPPAFDEVLRCGTERCAACRPIGSGRRCSSCVTPSMVQRHCVTPARRSSMSWARVHGSDWTAADILCGPLRLHDTQG